VRPRHLDDPGPADSRGPGSFLWWLARHQWQTLAAGVVWGVVWMCCQAVLPALIGWTIDHGLVARDRSVLVWMSLALLGLGLLQATSAILRHRCAVSNWLTAAYRTVLVTSEHAARLGATLPRRLSTGDVVAVGTSDLARIGQLMDVTARGSGSVVSFVVVAVLLLDTSTVLGTIVLVGVPALVLLLWPVMGPLQRRAMRQREHYGDLVNVAADIVAGLRILRGVGGEAVFLKRYVEESRRVKRSGIDYGRVHSVLDAAQVALPGIFVVTVVWLGARFAVEGRITVGELVAFYGYSAFLMIPLRTATELVGKAVAAWVAAGRVCRVLQQQPEHGDVPADAGGTTDSVPGLSDLVDGDSGARVRAGSFTAVVATRPEDAAALADRLGRFAPGEVTWGGQRLDVVPLAEVRRRIVVSDTDSVLFSGRLRDELDVLEHDEAALLEAVRTAVAEDVLEALPGGLSGRVDERGRSFSGGQRQRLVLARAVLLDPEVLVLVEPTSAVDAHTEARIAERLAAARAGRTTVVTTSSPLVLDRADTVVFLSDGVVAATGRHHDLLRECPAYAATVTRAEEVGV
jgi:ABC-type multidrug transport system fused ATPase/permease subunit